MGGSKNQVRDTFWPKYAFPKGEASHPQTSTNPQRASTMPTIKDALCPKSSSNPSTASNDASSPKTAGTPLPTTRDVFFHKSKSKSKPKSESESTVP